MHPEFESVQQSYGKLLDRLSASDARIHPGGDPDSWCVQELIEHLILTYRSTASVLEERLQKGRPTQAPLTARQQALWRATIRAGRFPEGGKAPEGVRPGQLGLEALCGAELAERFRLEMGKVDSLLNECAEKFGSQPMASHFAFGPLSAEQWRTFHTVHARHHLAQLGRILAGVH